MDEYIIEVRNEYIEGDITAEEAFWEVMAYLSKSEKKHTDTDMQGFAEWIGKKGWEYHPAYDGWKIYNEYKNTTQLLDDFKAWKKANNG